MHNIHQGLTYYVVSRPQDKLIMVKDIVCAFTTYESLSSGRGIAKLFGVGTCNMKRARDRQIVLDTQQDTSWLNYKHYQQIDALPESIKTFVLK